MQQFQVAGGPRWVGVDRFDIAARMPAGQPPELWPVMLQELLASRFRLVLRRATRETDGYALVVAGGAPRLTAVDASKCAVANSSCGMSASPTQIVATGQSMDQLATRLSRSIGQTVVNRTGVTGIYDFTVQWTQDEPFREPGATASPAIFTALTEHLGLRLRSQRIPVEALIIESVERPTPD